MLDKAQRTMLLQFGLELIGTHNVPIEQRFTTKTTASLLHFVTRDSIPKLEYVLYLSVSLTFMCICSKCGAIYSSPMDENMELRVILFQRPRGLSLQYLSVDELNPDLVSLKSKRPKERHPLLEKVKRQCGHKEERRPPALCFHDILEKINSSFEIDYNITGARKFMLHRRTVMRFLGQLSLPFVRLACVVVYLFRVFFGVVIYGLNWGLPRLRVSTKQIFASGILFATKKI